MFYGSNRTERYEYIVKLEVEAAKKIEKARLERGRGKSLGGSSQLLGCRATIMI